MFRREFLKIPAGIIVLTAIPSLILASKENELVGWKYNPTTADELFTCINKISSPIGSLSNKAYENVEFTRFTHTSYGLITGEAPDAERRLVRSMWISMVNIIGNKHPIVFWRRIPSMETHNEFDTQARWVRLTMRLSIGPDATNPIMAREYAKPEGEACKRL